MEKQLSDESGDGRMLGEAQADSDDLWRFPLAGILPRATECPRHVPEYQPMDRVDPPPVEQSFESPGIVPRRLHEL